MNVRHALGLLLAPDLHAIARRLAETEEGLKVAQDWIEEALAEPVASGTATRLWEAREAVVESRARLIETRADLTGRRPDALLNRG